MAAGVTAHPAQSYATFPVSVFSDPALGGRERLVYVALLTFADFGTLANCRPSLTAVAKRAGCSRSHVQRAMDNLEEAGWVKRQARHKQDSLMCLPSLISFPKQQTAGAKKPPRANPTGYVATTSIEQPVQVEKPAPKTPAPKKQATKVLNHIKLDDPTVQWVLRLTYLFDEFINGGALRDYVLGSQFVGDTLWLADELDDARAAQLWVLFQLCVRTRRSQQTRKLKVAAAIKIDGGWWCNIARNEQTGVDLLDVQEVWDMAGEAAKLVYALDDEFPEPGSGVSRKDHAANNPASWLSYALDPDKCPLKVKGKPVSSDALWKYATNVEINDVSGRIAARAAA